MSSLCPMCKDTTCTGCPEAEQNEEFIVSQGIVRGWPGDSSSWEKASE